MFGVHDLAAKSYVYAPLESDEHSEKQRSRSESLKIRLAQWCLLLLVVFGAGSLGFLAGRGGTYAPSSKIEHEVHLGTTQRVLQYNNTFANFSEESNAAWKALIPHRGGFFNHPTIAPHRSVFSVFHQLHCLNGMRQGYWALYAAMQEQKVLNEEDMPEMSSPMHFKHCIDLIRQVLMCRPDLTLEQKVGKKGVEGFGTEHECRNYGDLLAFVSEWENWGRT